MNYGKVIKKVNIVAIPKHLLPVMNDKGLSLAQLDAELAFLRSVGYEEETVVGDALRDKMVAMFSKSDMCDYFSANKILDRILYNNDYNNGETPLYNGRVYSLFRTIPETMLQAAEEKFINSMIDPKLNLDGVSDVGAIILNKDASVIEFVVHDNTVFVVVGSGFSNFIIYNNYDFMNFITEHLLDVIFRFYTEDVVTNHPLFMTLLRK